MRILPVIAAGAVALSACARPGGGETSGAAPSIRFAIEVGGDTARPVYVATQDGGGAVGWLRVTHAGQPVYLRERCDIEDCGVDPAVCGMAIPLVRQVEGRVEYQWDAMTSTIDSAARCERRVRAPPGEYVARFCYGHEVALQGEGDVRAGAQGTVVEPRCETRGFTLRDREVILRL